MSNKQAQSATAQEPDLKKFNRLEVKFSDTEVQFVGKELERKVRIQQSVDLQFAETLQHFAVLCAKRKNIQFADNLFAGVFYDTKKERAYILLYKSEQEAKVAKEPKQPKQ